MKNIIYPTPEGTETIYETVLLTRIECLKSQLDPLRKAYATDKGMTKFLPGMLPPFVEAWQAAQGHPLYLEITPAHLYGAGLAIPCEELSLTAPPTTLMERWAFLLVLADNLTAGLPANTAEVCPLYLENGLNLAVGNDRAEILLRPLRKWDV